MNVLPPASPYRVFVVQDQYTRDPATNQLASKFDFTEAKSFGELTFLLPPAAHPFPPNDAIISTLTDKLYDFDDNDFLLLTGNPVLIGWCAAIAAHVNGGKLRFLQWNGRKKCYLEVPSNLYKFF